MAQTKSLLFLLLVSLAGSSTPVNKRRGYCARDLVRKMDDSSASSSVSFVSQETQLIEAVLNEDYVVLKEWIKNNLLDVTSDKKLYLSLKAKNVASKLIRVAAHKGKTAIVDLLRKHGEGTVLVGLIINS